MLILEKKGKLKWNSANRKRYLDLGYEFTSWGEEFLVDIEHLTDTTRAIVYYQCDYCGKTDIETEFKKYNQNLKRSITRKDCCDDCIREKIKESSITKYGTDSPNKSNIVKEKKKEVSIERYGVENVSQIHAVKEKVKNTVLNKYGVENVFASEEIKGKIKSTVFDKYGVEYFTQTEEQKEKSKLTNISKFGVPFASQSEEFRNKVVTSMYKNGNAPSSKQQRYLHNLIGGEINYPLKRYNLDIALVNDKIAIEYDGGGHWLNVELGHITIKEFNRRDYFRSKSIYNENWKIIRIISKKDLLPSDSIILDFIKEGVNYLKTDRHWIELDVDKSLIRSSQFEKYIELGDTRKVEEVV